MLLSEPPSTRYDLCFHLLRIPVRVHPIFWAVALLFGLSGNSEPKAMLIWVGAVFVSILVHEMGHALLAQAHGWPPHITLYGMGGLASYRPTYHATGSQIAITAAGPLAGFLFAALLCGAIAVSGHDIEFRWSPGDLLPVRMAPFATDQANWIVADLLYINVFWGLVNLLPIYPLDGGQIARELIGLVDPAGSVRTSLWLSVIAAAGMAFIAYTRLHNEYLAFFFGYLAYMSYQAVQSAFGPRGSSGGFP
ncbi:MAG TPA: site-2 protease family protein [Pirellulales bacterium]|jgi:Zn-dependent protease|nr:site-2 protease family protein [Pirellulales bacterium]